MEKTDRLARRYLAASIRKISRGPFRAVLLTSTEQKEQAADLEERVLGDRPDPGSYRVYGIYDEGKLVAMTRVDTRPLDKWKRDEAFPILESLKPDVWISATAVNPAYRGRGLAFALREFLKRKYKSIMTSSGSISDPAIRHLNRKQGFRVVLDRPHVTVYHWKA